MSKPSHRLEESVKSQHDLQGSLLRGNIHAAAVQFVPFGKQDACGLTLIWPLCQRNHIHPPHANARLLDVCCHVHGIAPHDLERVATRHPLLRVHCITTADSGSDLCACAEGQSCCGQWQEHDLALAEELDEYWDRLTELAGGLASVQELKDCFPFSNVREVGPKGICPAPARRVVRDLIVSQIWGKGTIVT